MKRFILGLTLRDQLPNKEIDRRTKVVDAIEWMASLKWNWADHIAKIQNGR